MTIREHVIVMLREFSRGKEFSREDAIRLADSNPAATAQASRQVLKELRESKGPTSLEQCKVLDVAWAVLDIRACLHSILPEASEDASILFLREELRERPHQFSDSVLRELLTSQTDGSVLMAVKQAQIAQVKQKISGTPA